MGKFRLLHSLSVFFGGFIRWKKSSDDELSSNTSASCDVESLQLAVEGEGSFYYIVQRYRVGSWKKREEGDVTEEDEEDEDGIRFSALESQVENKGTVLNW